MLLLRQNWPCFARKAREASRGEENLTNARISKFDAGFEFVGTFLPE